MFVEPKKREFLKILLNSWFTDAFFLLKNTFALLKYFCIFDALTNKYIGKEKTIIDFKRCIFFEL